MASANQELVFDWNVQGGPELPPGRKYMLDDESLRDGLQSPSVRRQLRAAPFLHPALLGSAHGLRQPRTGF